MLILWVKTRAALPAGNQLRVSSYMPAWPFGERLVAVLLTCGATKALLAWGRWHPSKVCCKRLAAPAKVPFVMLCLLSILVGGSDQVLHANSLIASSFFRGYLGRMA